jgi:NADPH:quinone reductase-like Zn-dependent oxidoreductase
LNTWPFRFRGQEKCWCVQFCGANAEYEIAIATMIALKPFGITDIEAASVPVVAATAWQMLFDYAPAEPGQTVMTLEPLVT